MINATEVTGRAEQVSQVGPKWLKESRKGQWSEFLLLFKGWGQDKASYEKEFTCLNLPLAPKKGMPSLLISLIICRTKEDEGEVKLNLSAVKYHKMEYTPQTMNDCIILGT